MSESTDYLSLLTRMYGPHWAAPLARDIAREESTVYGWKAAGRLPKPVQAWLRRREEAHESRRETHPAQGAKAGAGRQGRGVPGVMPQSCPKPTFPKETDPTEGL